MDDTNVEVCGENGAYYKVNQSKFNSVIVKLSIAHIFQKLG